MNKNGYNQVLTWSLLTILWAVLLIMDIKSGFPSPFITGLRVVCLISSFMAALKNYKKYKK